MIYSPYCSYPKIERYFDEWQLERLRNRILVDMPVVRDVEKHDIYKTCDYDRSLYKHVMSVRENPYTGEPIMNASELCLVLRRIVNSNETRIAAVKDILKDHPKAIIFYNFNYELEMLREAFPDAQEWNGHKHEIIPVGDSWVYLVQYTAGAEGWNCITTDTIIFFSQNYSYKILIQSRGRIDRINTPYKDLYYYHLKSTASIDAAIAKALKNKKDFNARGWVK